MNIPLVGGKGFALIDDSDAHLVIGHRWCYDAKHHDAHYVAASIDGKRVPLHRLIMGFPDSPIDHISGDTRDNRRTNLRICTHSENMRNRHIQIHSSRFKGVSWCKKGSCWVARIFVKPKDIYLGRFKDEEAAAREYDAAARDHFREFARLNFPNSTLRNIVIPSPYTKVQIGHFGRTKTTGCSSRFKGVCWAKRQGKWLASIKKQGVRHFLGYFTTEEAAAAAYRFAAIELFGEFARF